MMKKAWAAWKGGKVWMIVFARVVRVQAECWLPDVSCTATKQGEARWV